FAFARFGASWADAAACRLACVVAACAARGRVATRSGGGVLGGWGWQVRPHGWRGWWAWKRSRPPPLLRMVAVVCGAPTGRVGAAEAATFPDNRQPATGNRCDCRLQC